MNLNSQNRNLLNDTAALIKNIALDPNRKNQNRMIYSTDIKKNIIQLAKEVPIKKLSQQLNIPLPSVKYILYKSALAPKKFKEKKVEKPNDVFKFIEISKGGINNPDEATTSQNSTSIKEKKIFMKLTTSSGIIVEIFD